MKMPCLSLDKHKRKPHQFIFLRHRILDNFSSRGTSKSTENWQLEDKSGSRRLSLSDENKGKVKKHEAVSYFLPRNCPILASHRPHLCNVTPRYLELPLEKPVLCLRRMWTNSSLDRVFICANTTIKQRP